MTDKDSLTRANLMQAFDMDCLAYARYILCARRAGQEGFAEIRDVFYQMAQNRLIHAGIWQELLGSPGYCDMQYVIADILQGSPDTRKIYTAFADMARAEGYTEIAIKLALAANVKAEHQKKLAAIMHGLDTVSLFVSDTRRVWECTVCGNCTSGYIAPDVCTLCGAPQASIKNKNTDL